jgi:hypothetical protein
MGGDTIHLMTASGSTSVYGGSLVDTTGDGADSLTIVGDFSGSFLQANAGNDTINLDATANSNASIKGGKGNDQVEVAQTVNQSVVTGDLGNDSIILTGVVSQSSVWGGSLTDTTADGSDSIDFVAGATLGYVQLNAGNDTLDLTVSSQTTALGGKGNDSITAGGGQLDIRGNLGNDTLNFTASTQSKFDAGAGNNFIQGAYGTASTNTVLGGSGVDTLVVTSGNAGKSYLGAGNDSIRITAVAGGTIFGGSSLQDTAAGNDSLNIGTSVLNTKIDLAGSSNYITGTGSTITSSVYGGTGSDTLFFGGVTSGRFVGAGGNDSLSFAALTTAASSVVGGAGNDTIHFAALSSATSVAGGLGNDSISFAAQASHTNAATYFFEGGSDTLTFATRTTQTADIFTFSTLAGAYTSIVTGTAGTTGITISGVSGGISTQLALVENIGGTQSGGINFTTYDASTYTNLTSIG